MLNQFSRFQLIVGKEAMDILKNKKVAVFGIGGVGGNVVDALARSGICHFVLIDNDKVCITNINRQLIANMENVGKDKVDVMEEHILSINPSAKVEKRKRFYLPSNAHEFNFKEYDYVVDAIDTVSAKIDIICKCKELGIPIISALGCGNKMNPTMLEVSDLAKTSYDPLAKVLRRELRKRNIEHLKVVYSKEKPIKPNEDLSISYREESYSSLENSEHHVEKREIPGSSAFVPPVAGNIIASEVVKDLIDFKK